MKKAVVAGIVIALGLFTLLSKEAAPPEFPVLETIATESAPHLSPHRHTEADQVADEGHGVMVEAETLVLEKDAWVQGVRVEVKNAPRVMLHHTNILVDLPAGALGANSILQFPSTLPMSVGQDQDEILSLPAPYAFMLPAGSRIRVSAMLHNPKPPKGPGGDYHDVSVVVSLLGTSFNADDARLVLPVLIALIDRNSSHNDSFSVPSNVETYTRFPTDPNDAGRGSFVFPVDGTLVGLGAHLHAWEGGKKVEVYLNGQRIHAFVPPKGEADWEWDTKRVILMRKVKAGDVLTLSATYANPHDAPILGAMAMVNASYAPDFPLPEGYALLAVTRKE